MTRGDTLAINASDTKPPLPRVLAAIGGIYVAQGVVSGLTFLSLPSVLRAQGLPLDRIGLSFLAILPWSLKFLWAPAVERMRLPAHGAQSSRTIVAAGLILVAAMLALAAWIGPSVFLPLLAVLIAAAFASASFDIACDGFAVETLTRAARGWGNAAQVGGAYVGSAIGSGLFLVLVAGFGWGPATAAMASLVLVLGLPFVLVSGSVAQNATRAHRPSLTAAFARFDVRRGLLLTLLFSGGQKLAQGMLGPFLVDSGLGLGTLGLVNGIGGMGAGLCGTAIGGALVRRRGAKRAVSRAIVAQTLMIAAFALVAAMGLRQPALLAGLALLNSLVLALGFVALFGELMGYASLDQAGVDFTLFQCADSTMALCGGYGGALLARQASYAPCFILAFGLATIATPAIPRVLRRTPPA